MRRGTGPTPGDRPARFPGYDVVAQREAWDDVTAGVVLSRLGPPPPLEFFTPAEGATAGALLDRLLGQDDDPKIPVLELIDARLLERKGDGYRYDDMPEDAEAWKRSIEGLDADARAAGHDAFHALTVAEQMDMLEQIQQSSDPWHGMPPGRVFNLWMRYACTAFYSHPWAWNEIGFGGPAYPRGYANLGFDARETWERPEQHAADPIPWVQRAESFKQAHARRERMPR